MRPARLATEVIGRARRSVNHPEFTDGNHVGLLRSGAEFFPALLLAIETAKVSVAIETYIFARDVIGQRVIDALASAASRGVRVNLMIDGFGAGDTAAWVVNSLSAFDVDVMVYRPARWWRLERQLLRRLHRKTAVIDGRFAFVGGINIIDDQNHPDRAAVDLGPRFDFAVIVEGPLVAALALSVERLRWSVMLRQLQRAPGPWPHARMLPTPARFADGVRASLLLRDNFRNRSTIERAYLDGMKNARSDMIIANAYFLPGRPFRQALIELAERGVRVRILAQGRIEYVLQHHAQRALYGQLLEKGIEVYEYLPSYLHAKTAVIDDNWATVGSSNIDPYSLLLAREANVLVLDRIFARALRSELEAAIELSARRVDRDVYAHRSLAQRAFGWVAFAIVRLLTVIATRRSNG